MTTLTRAWQEWSSRPADERYASLEELHASALRSQHEARTVDAAWASLETVVESDTLMLKRRSGAKGMASLSNWAFSQVARQADAPASYLATLPPALASDCLNHGLATAEGNTKLLFNLNGSLVLRAATGTGYTRIYDADVTKRLLMLQAQGWNPAPAAFDGSRGLYRGDRDMFVFMVDNTRRIFETLPGGGLSRGFFCWNSEVGAASFGIGTFLYEYVCGNHRVWGVSGYTELRIRHVGNADDRAFGELQGELRRYSDSSASEEEARIESARSFSLGTDKDAVLDRVFGLKLNGLTRTLLEQGYERAVEHEDWYGSPRSAWGFAGGLTEVARDLPNADQRTLVDRAAGRVMELAF